MNVERAALSLGKNCVSPALHAVLCSLIGILTYAPASCRTSQYRRTFILLSVSVLKDLADPVSGLTSRANVFYWPGLLAHFFSSTIFPFSSFSLWVGIVGLGSSDCCV